MDLFSEYKGLRKENYVLFFGRMVTNMGAMIWSMMTMILNLKMGYNATEELYRRVQENMANNK